MKNLVSTYPSLKGILVEYIKPKKYVDQKTGQSLKIAFEAALIRSGEYPKDYVNIIVKSVVGYLDLPIILDNLDDVARRVLKGEDKSLSTILRENMMHRIMISYVSSILTSCDEILCDNAVLIEENSNIGKISNENGKYLQWNRTQRVEFVIEVMIPFIVKVCTGYIDTH